MLKIVIHTAFAIIISSYLIWSSAHAEESPSVTQSPDAMEVESTQSFLSSVSDSHFEKDFSASVGVKMWMNQWSLPYPVGDGQNLIASFTSGTETTLIPVFSVRTKNWFVSGSYFTKTEYGFAKQSIDVPLGLPSYTVVPLPTGGTVVEQLGAPAGLKVPIDVSIDNERTEWDINAGYYLHKYLLVTAGYKEIKREAEVTGTIPDLDVTVIGSNGVSSTARLYDAIPKEGRSQKFKGGPTKSSGPTLGIAGVVPLQGRFGLYGNFAYGRLGNGDKDPADYYLGEMGLLYSFKIAKVIDAAAVSLGYRFQSLYLEADNGLDVRDGTEGFALTLTASF